MKTIEVVNLTDAEKALIKRLAEQDNTVLAECETVYAAHYKEFIKTRRKSVEMNFLLEMFTKTPAAMLRSKYRKQILDGQD